MMRACRRERYLRSHAAGRVVRESRLLRAFCDYCTTRRRFVLYRDGSADAQSCYWHALAMMEDSLAGLEDVAEAPGQIELRDLRKYRRVLIASKGIGQATFPPGKAASPPEAARVSGSLKKGLGTGQVMSYGRDMSTTRIIAKQDGTDAAPQMRDAWNYSFLAGTRPR